MRHAWSAAILFVYVFAAACGSDGGNDTPAALGTCGDGTVDAGEACDDAGESATCNLDCTAALCGDGKVNGTAGEECDRAEANADNADCTASCLVNVCGDGHPNTAGPNHIEACDDGNAIDTDGCSSSCRLASCGNGVLDAGEECDDGNAVDTDGCVGCLYATCGDGFVNAGVEECDNGAQNAPGGTCLPICRWNVCGDGFVQTESTPLDPAETCDDGNTSNEATCPYGTQSCTGCSSDCSVIFTLSGNVCGDGVVDPVFEACDDGNAVTELTCPYGLSSCSVCNASCVFEPVSVSLGVCGDGVINSPYETCDDGNADACGTCSADCQTAQPSGVATGLIGAISGAALTDGETLTLSDGINAAVVFEFDKNGATATGTRAISITNADSDAVVASAIVSAIGSAAPNLAIGASSYGAVVTLSDQRATSFGNVPITETVADWGFYVAGMAGGGAGDCGVTVGCVSSADCLSGSCGVDSLCQ